MKTIPRGSDGQIDWQAVHDRLARRPEDTGGVASEREQAVLETRARILARAPPAAADAGDVLEIVVLEIDRERYAIESQFVRDRPVARHDARRRSGPPCRRDEFAR